MQIIIVLILVCLGFALLKALFKALWGLIKWILGLLVIGIVAVLCYTYRAEVLRIALIGLMGGIVLYGAVRILSSIKSNLKNNRMIKENKEWLRNNQISYTVQQVDECLEPLIENIYNQDVNDWEYKFDRNNLPYGRVNAFLNYFDTNIYQDEPYYYSCIPSKDENEFREYGVLITRQGVYVSYQKKNESGEAYQAVDRKFAFSGLKDVSVEGNVIKGQVIDSSTFFNRSQSIVVPANTIDVNALALVCKGVVANKISGALLANQVVDLTYAESQMEESDKKLKDMLDKESLSNIATVAAIGGATSNFSEMYGETKGYLNARGGGGYAAEYANNTFDRLRGLNAESTAQVLDVHGRQVKAGADRTVNGVEIQTKYYKTPAESIGAAFENKQAVYIRSDGSEKMMQIEVPWDQYPEALKYMQKRIDSGQVPNVEPGEDAATYVRRGLVTYDQAFSICKAGSIEGLVVDFTSGVICSTSAAGISAALVFAQAIWKGENIEDAAKASLSTGITVLGKSAVVYTLTMQLSRKEIINPFVKEYTADGIMKGFSGFNNPVYTVSENLASSIRNSGLAHTSVGSAMGLDRVTSKAIIGNSVMVAVVFGPDICKALNGRISIEQLLKNSVIGVGGLVGAGIGNAILPGVGGFIGGGIGGIVTKNFMDSFVEDDAKKMFRILKEEFLDCVMMAGLTTEEFENVVKQTVSHPQLTKILQDMYASGNYRIYAKYSIVEPAVSGVIGKRKLVTIDAYDKGVEKLLCQYAS